MQSRKLWKFKKKYFEDFKTFQDKLQESYFEPSSIPGDFIKQ